VQIPARAASRAVAGLGDVELEVTGLVRMLAGAELPAGAIAPGLLASSTIHCDGPGVVVAGRSSSPRRRPWASVKRRSASSR
jgi:hypothetical protein